MLSQVSSERSCRHRVAAAARRRRGRCCRSPGRSSRSLGSGTRSQYYLNATVRRAKKFSKEAGQSFINLDEKISMLFHMQHHYKSLVNAKNSVRSYVYLS